MRWPITTVPVSPTRTEEHIASAPAPAPPTAFVERTHMTMGAELRLTAYTTDETHTLDAFDAAFREVDRLDAIMSVWKPGSEILQLNAAAGDGPVPGCGLMWGGPGCRRTRRRLGCGRWQRIS